jgi:hypothetical protein
MTEFLKLSYEEWVATYLPIDNEFNPNVAGGQLFEIPCSEEERKFLQSVETSKLWSYGSGEFGGTYIWSGESAQGLENFGAYVTEIGYEGNAIIEVEVSEPEYTCPNCEMDYVGELAIEQRKKFEDECEDCGTLKSCTNCGAECSHEDFCECGYDDWFNGTEKWELIKESFIAKYGEPK